MIFIALRSAKKDPKKIWLTPSILRCKSGEDLKKDRIYISYYILMLFSGVESP